MSKVPTYFTPVVLGASGFVGMCSDIAGKPIIAYCLVAFLVAMALCFALGRPAVLVDFFATTTTLKDTGDRIGIALTCCVLAVGVVGATVISQRVGGITEKAFPEIAAALDQRLGVVQEKVETIAADSRTIAKTTDALVKDGEFVKKAVGQWIGVERMDLYGKVGEFNFDTIFLNRSAFIFEDVNMIIRDADDPSLIFVNDIGRMMAPGATRLWRPKMVVRPEHIEICISGKRRDDGLLLKEVWHFRAPDSGFEYQLIKATGTTVFEHPKGCV